LGGTAPCPVGGIDAPESNTSIMGKDMAKVHKTRKRYINYESRCARIINYVTELLAKEKEITSESVITEPYRRLVNMIWYKR